MIEESLIIALTATFWHVSTFEGMINSWIRRVTFRFPKWINKPLYDCPVCSSFWIGLVILSTGGLPCHGVVEGLLILFSACGIASILTFFIPQQYDDSDEDS